MEKVKIKKIYKHESFVLFAVSPSNFIEWGTSSQSTLCFALDSLAMQWNISKELLDTISSYDMNFKDSLSYSSEEDSKGTTRIFMINVDAISALLRKLYATGQCSELDTVGENKKVNELINKVKRGEITWKE
ncbi:hypothetical protein [Paenibacillus sp. Soil750]|uniref:hypothetical protein n=1 Tax=Paenibacillus sp. Soil750 TaxID=1736398 RepID=UPI0007006F85|nr:hypothetical protein [Paenibacillus sp. Soil750]KRE70867.1 hypothetical protein ASL11_11275 [Paenibacillus sp. Soil750]